MNPIRHSQRAFATAIASVVLAAILLGSPNLDACIAYFGYASTAPTDVAAITSSVRTSVGYYLVSNQSEDVLSAVSQINQRIGPAVLNLENLIWDPSETSGIDCRHYERGGISENVSHYQTLPNYSSAVQSFLNAHISLFEDSSQVLGLVVSTEANNRCIENRKLNAVANTIRGWFAARPSLYLPRLIVGYGLDNTYINGQPVVTAKGLPFDINGNKIGLFPYAVTTIAYYAYDIWDPNDDANPKNLNDEDWSSLSDKITQALRPGQKTLGVLRAYCGRPGAAVVERSWGISCPGQAAWKLGVVADNWRRYWLDDPRNEGVFAFGWQDWWEAYGSQSLSTIWAQHSAINDTRNCTLEE
jgi:hypothetical protein